jgi:flagellin
MALVVNSNIPALQTYNALNVTTNALQKSIQKLSGGLRVNSAADDAAGLAISEKMRAQIRGLDRAVSNSQDGISMIQTAEGAMSESHSILQRMRELSVQAANDTLTRQDRAYIQLEVDQLKEELDRIGNTTQFNKKKLLNGDADALWSTNLQGTKVLINGTMMSRDLFGQTETFEGNYVISANIVEMGQNQVLKSNIFTRKLADGQILAANEDTELSEIMNFYDANGVSLLAQPQVLTISLADGSSASIQLYAGDTLGSLGTKLSNALSQASGVAIPEGAAAQYVTDGVASAIEKDQILNELATNWLWGAAKRVYEALGDSLGSGGGGVSVKIEMVEDAPGGAWAWGGGWIDSSGAKEGFIRIDLLDALGADPDTMDRTIAHEFAHVLSFTTPWVGQALNDNIWLAEGLAEYIHGANDRVKNESAAGNDLTAAAYAVLGGGTPIIDVGGGYSAAYLLTRYFDEQSKANGGTGLKGLLTELQTNQDPNVTDNMNYAMNAASNGLFTGVGDLTAVVGGAGSLNGIALSESYSDFVNRVLLEDPTVDTGAIDGSYVTGDPSKAKNWQTVVQGNDSFSLNPMEPWGWVVDWSDVISGASTNASLIGVLPKSDTLQSVNGTLLLHSTLLGNAGKMTISGDERLIQALGFAEVQSARDTIYDVAITDAHSGKVIKSGVRVSGNTLYGELHDNIDIRFINNFAVDLDASGLKEYGYGSFVFSGNGRGSFIVHIAASSVVLQIGANEGENMNVSFGDIRAAALGVDAVNLRDRDLAARSITLIDNAIDRVSTKRAKLGAYQNRLEHTITNLTVAGENLTSSESRIRDTDMAKEMINFTKLQIMLQAGTSMLAQSNALPQNILSLLR